MRVNSVTSSRKTWVRYGGLLLAVTLLARSAAAPPAPPIAVVSDVIGEAFLVAPRAYGDRPVLILSELRPGQVVRLEPGCRLTVIFVPGGQVIELEGGGRFVVRIETIEPLDRSGVSRSRQRDGATKMLS